MQYEQCPTTYSALLHTGRKGSKKGLMVKVSDQRPLLNISWKCSKRPVQPLTSWIGLYNLYNDIIYVHCCIWWHYSWILLRVMEIFIYLLLMTSYMYIAACDDNISILWYIWWHHSYTLLHMISLLYVAASIDIIHVYCYIWWYHIWVFLHIMACFMMLFYMARQYIRYNICI